jgi:methylated-DNA-[protein]-cysteine S-methyltransferase
MPTNQLQITTTKAPRPPAHWTETVLDFNGHSMPLVIGGDRDTTGRDVVVGVRFGPPSAHAAWLARAPRDDEALAPAVNQLQHYAAGEITGFDLALRLTGSDFQVAVWKELLNIPYGTTTTYGRVAAAVGRGPSASRAVGSAVGSNPVPIIVPCHRVIGSDGSLTGFGGGLDNKVALLSCEGVTAL